MSIFPFTTAVNTSNTTLENNLISTAVFGSPIRVLGAFYTLASLPATVTRNANIGNTPVFQNAAGRNYTLLAGPGKNAASDGVDIGARMSSVGIGAGNSVIAAPTNLRIVPQ